MTQVIWKDHKLVYIETGRQVFSTTPIDWQQEPGWHITGGELPKHISFPGKVYLENTLTGLTRVLNANIVGCKWEPLTAPIEERRK